MKVHKDYNAYKVLMSPRDDAWQVMLLKGEPDNDGMCDAVIKDYDHNPSIEEIRADVFAAIDSQTDQRILSGHTYEGAMVWLSPENQMNYKAAYDLAVQFKGAHGTLPLVFKFGTTDEPVYREFKTLEDLTGFYLGVVAHKTACLTAGWQRKDNIDWERYVRAL